MKKLLILGLGVAILLCFTACCGQLNGNSSKSYDDTQSTLTSYENIYEEYVQKIRAATPGLIEEYKSEAKSNTEGLNGLATLSNNKISELAKISTEGIEKMAKIMMNKGTGKYDEYEEWAGKLQDVYMEEAQKITDAYMGSATN